MREHPILMAFAKGAAVSLGYFGMKYLVKYVVKRMSDPDREPFITVTFGRADNGGSDNA